jgi:hypothetical protein
MNNAIRGVVFRFSLGCVLGCLAKKRSEVELNQGGWRVDAGQAGGVEIFGENTGDDAVGTLEDSLSNPIRACSISKVSRKVFGDRELRSGYRFRGQVKTIGVRNDPQSSDELTEPNHDDLES